MSKAPQPPSRPADAARTDTRFRSRVPRIVVAALVMGLVLSVARRDDSAGAVEALSVDERGLRVRRRGLAGVVER